MNCAENLGNQPVFSSYFSLYDIDYTHIDTYSLYDIDHTLLYPVTNVWLQIGLEADKEKGSKMSELLDEKFKNVKKTPGVQIWRIEKLEMKEDFHFSIMNTN